MSDAEKLPKEQQARELPCLPAFLLSFSFFLLEREARGGESVHMWKGASCMRSKLHEEQPASSIA